MFNNLTVRHCEQSEAIQKRCLDTASKLDCFANIHNGRAIGKAWRILLNQIIFLALLSIGLTSCTALSPIIKHQYTLTKYDSHPTHQRKLPALFITQPEAVAGFQTEEMLYRKFDYQTKAYAHNAWSSPPHEMLYPLFIQSLQDSHAFRVVGSGMHAEISNYNLDTQLLEFIQNHNTKPSHIELKVKAMITDTTTAKLIASKVFRVNVPCPVDSPYGGAIAANIASQQLTKELTQYTIAEVRRNT